MGAWGTAIFSDDTAADTRDAFSDFIADGLSSEEATERLVAESGEILEDEDEALVFWLAIAATQWTLGRLIDSVRERALQIIDSEADLRRWADNAPAEIGQRKKHLAKLREKLTSPQPKPKKLKSVLKSSTDFQVGDIASFRLDESLAVRFCVLGLWSDRGGTNTQICLLGIEDGSRWTKKRLTLAETLGPQYTMLSHEPAELITVLESNVKLPADSLKRNRAWLHGRMQGRACTWAQFPYALREILPQLGWV